MIERWGRFWVMEILSTGVYPIGKDRFWSVAEEDLQEISAAYKEKSGEPLRAAPIVIGHPANDRPAYGTVGFLAVEGKTLFGFSLDLSAAVRMELKEGQYKTHAAQFYAPENPLNPKPGTWYLKHVGLKGEVPRSVLGYLTPGAEYAEYMKQHIGDGRRIEPWLRTKAAGCVEIVDFACAPLNGDDLGRRARAWMRFSEEVAEFESVLSASDAVEMARALSPAVVSNHTAMSKD